MTLTGKHFIGNRESAGSTDSFSPANPSLGTALEPLYFEATEAEIDDAVSLATAAFDPFRRRLAEARADFLDAIANETLALGDELLLRASAETGHPLPRCASERDRAVLHTRQFAELVREGSWVDARIDLPDPTRQPLPKPDVRSLMQPVGPVAIFGASNFPIAISVLGADTMSAFAAGCPVVIKAHPGHPGTCELAARAILRAAEATRMPDGVFSLLHGKSNAVGTALVSHPGIVAAAFTGSLGGGRALYNVANARPVPIPFYAEMGSVNPVFMLPGALKARGARIAEGFVAALTAGVGQFCTNPGLVLGLESEEWADFSETAREKVAAWAPATMLHAGIHSAYESGIADLLERKSVELLGHSATAADPAKSEAAAYLFRTTQESLLDDPTLLNELFGPVSTLVSCGSPDDMIAIAEKLEGSLSATIHGTETDLADYRELVTVLQRKAGRLIFNGYPVGIEVCHSMHHGGPYPATTHSHFTSIGTRAVSRFIRPVCYQDWPDTMLPMELQNANPRGVWRMLNGQRTRDGVVG
ncbi:MAG: aldehyde dehydrogenase (NADP(+)) [Verrucomicrobiales bacterium]|jgi:2,5-dioxopentanoate dehydrogenase|nr:aldehyde dehydrogenase (NADP(+)) [Verrucomicrobiales bacterium]MDP4793579.1 aldehyde dehydrogenase (NADP(+)) [Verrucomicrobiales bacterium]MDP5004683.1 aldehyde dehydrogenase (NADP(+)) [Verrucomicrobiales bacterium]